MVTLPVPIRVVSLLVAGRNLLVWGSGAKVKGGPLRGKSCPRLLVTRPPQWPSNLPLMAQFVPCKFLITEIAQQLTFASLKFTLVGITLQEAALQRVIPPTLVVTGSVRPPLSSMTFLVFTLWLIRVRVLKLAPPGHLQLVKARSPIINLSICPMSWLRSVKLSALSLMVPKTVPHRWLRFGRSTLPFVMTEAMVLPLVP